MTRMTTQPLCELLDAKAAPAGAGLALHLDACHPAAELDTEAMAWQELAALLLRWLS